MAAFLHLLKPQSNPSLAPMNTVVHRAASANRVVRKGDHLVVMVGGWRTGYAHHGIALGPDADGSIRVADFSRPGEGVVGNELRFRSLKSFIGRQEFFGVVPYPNQTSEPEADKEVRDMTVQRAEVLVAIQAAGELGRLVKEPRYDVLRWNCETFAGLCVTGSLQPSEQALRVLDAITYDLRKGRESFLLQTAEVIYGALSLVIMMLCKWLLD